MEDGYRHDAFISYSTVATAAVGRALEHGLETLGRGWEEERVMTVFRDVSDQPATASLGDDLTRHLDGSRFLIVVSSPAAAASRWVEDEIVHWLGQRGTDGLLLAIAEGDLRWVDGRFTDDSTLPEPLKTAFAEQPKWVDFRWATDGFDPAGARFVDKLADLSCVILDRRKDDLVGLHWAAYRRGLAGRLARSGQAATESSPVMGLVLSLAGSELDGTAETSLALCDALEKGSTLVRSIGGSTAVSAVGHDVSDDSLLLGFDDGTVAGLRPTDDPSRDPSSASDTGTDRGLELGLGLGVENGRPGPDQPVTAIAVSEDRRFHAFGYGDGSVVLADREEIRIGRGGGGICRLIAVSPTGRLAAVLTSNGEDELIIFDPEAADGDRGRRPDHRFVWVRSMRFDGADRLVVHDWSELVSLDAGTLSIESADELGALPRPGPKAISADGRVLAAAQFDEGGITVGSLGRADPVDVDDGFIEGPEGPMAGLGLSPRGDVLAQVSNGELWLWEPTKGEEPLDRLPISITEDQVEVIVGAGAGWVAVAAAGACEIHGEESSTLCRAIDDRTEWVPSVIRSALDVVFSEDGAYVAWIIDPGSFEGAAVAVHQIDGGRTWDLAGADGDPVCFLDFVDGQRLRLTTATGETVDRDLGTGDEVGRTPPTGTSFEQLEAERTGASIGEHHAGLGIVRAAAIDPQRGDVARGYSTGVITLVDDTGNQRWTVALPGCSRLSFDRSGQRLAALSGGGRVIVVDVGTGEVEGRFEVDDGPLHALRFSPDGSMLAVTKPGGYLALIDTSVESWRRRALHRAGRRMNATERHVFGLDRLPRLPARFDD